MYNGLTSEDHFQPTAIMTLGSGMPKTGVAQGHSKDTKICKPSKRRSTTEFSHLPILASLHCWVSSCFGLKLPENAEAYGSWLMNGP